MLKNGWTVQGEKNAIVLTKGNHKIVFDIKIPTKNVAIFGMHHRRSTEIAGAAMDVGGKMPLTKAHILLSHGNSDQKHNTSKELVCLLTREGIPPCSACAQANAKQENVLKESDNVKSKVNGDRFSTDISTVKIKKN